MAEPLTLEPPPKLTKKIRMKRAYSYNKNGDLVLRPPTPTKKRPRTFSYRKPNKNFAKVSVRRGTQELSGKERRTRIYELLYFIPSAVLKALTPKQLDNLLVAYRCEICEKVFRLPQGVKAHKEDAHENRTLLSFFKKKHVKKIEDVNNNKENEHSSEKFNRNDKPSKLVSKPSIKNHFKIRKTPVFVAKPLGVTPQKYRVRSETLARKSPENDKCTPRLDNQGKGSISKEKELHKNSEVKMTGLKGSQDLKTKPKLMTGKRWRQKKCLDIEKKDDQAASPSTPVIKTVSPTTPTPLTKLRPKLMTPKNWRKRLSTLTPQADGEKVSPSSEVHELGKELSLTTDLSAEIPEHVRKVPSPTIVSSPVSTKPKLMSNKKWNKKKLLANSDNACDPATDELFLNTDSNVNVKEKDSASTLPVLLHKV